MMSEYSDNLLREALGFYDFINPKAIFIRHNENITYSIEDENEEYLIRIHSEADGLDFSFFRGDFSREILIASEIDILNELLAENTIVLQRPIKNKNGYFLSHLKNGLTVTVLSWLVGETLYGIEFTNEIAYKIGQMTATLHKTANKLPPLNRCHYDDEFVDVILAELKYANELNHISMETYNKIEKISTQYKKILLEEKSNFTLIHSDLGVRNLIYNGETISPIDFSLSGYGMPEMDLGDLVINIGKNELLPFLFEGYESVHAHKINYEYLNVCKAFGFIQYIVIHHKKLYKDKKFQNRINRWCTTIFDPLISQF